MNVPTALASTVDAAKSVIAVSERQRQKRASAKPVFAMWIGAGHSVSQAFEAAGMPSYQTESGAIAGFMHLVRYRERRELLMATPATPQRGQRESDLSRGWPLSAAAVALTGERSEPLSLYQRSDGEWFLCRGQVCDQPSGHRLGGRHQPALDYRGRVPWRSQQLRQLGDVHRASVPGKKVRRWRAGSGLGP
jgi:hypothetical protein